MTIYAALQGRLLVVQEDTPRAAERLTPVDRRRLLGAPNNGA